LVLLKKGKAELVERATGRSNLLRFHYLQKNIVCLNMKSPANAMGNAAFDEYLVCRH
jgi:hypothetical protein